MKYFYFALTLLLHFVSILTLKLLDNYLPIILIFIGSLFLGVILKFSESIKVRNIGLGLMYGSLTSLILTIGFMILLSYSFSH
jgi:hypothetical protein